VRDPAAGSRHGGSLCRPRGTTPDRPRVRLATDDGPHVADLVMISRDGTRNGGCLSITGAAHVRGTRGHASAGPWESASRKAVWRRGHVLVGEAEEVFAGNRA